jgi:hypothetical protein
MATSPAFVHAAATGAARPLRVRWLVRAPLDGSLRAWLFPV